MYRYAYLIMVTPQNNNKYYEMTECSDGSFSVRYGRVGSTCVSTSYPMDKWNQKYREKIRKGYVDQTELHTVIEKEKSRYKDIDDKSVADLIERLDMYANAVIKANYTISVEKVTTAMVDKARSILNRLKSQKDLLSFNNSLLELFSVLPREMKSVNDYLCNDSSDIACIIERESELLDIISGQVKKSKAINPIDKSDIDNNKTILEALGLKIMPATQNEVNLILNHLDNSIKNKFKQAWAVTNTKTQARFENYLSRNANPKTMLLWHGSKNENWMSIINNGLLLNPNAKITGKMFGQGIYFAPSSKKSFNYTSIKGSYWAHGNANNAFMALYETIQDSPFDVYSYKSSYSNLTEKSLYRLDENAKYLHAHAGRDLRNDEIIYYREDQITIRYLVEFEYS